ncbi:MAG: hypothetical protein ABFD59_12850, partial [Smithella sp.]
ITPGAIDRSGSWIHTASQNLDIIELAENFRRGSCTQSAPLSHTSDDDVGQASGRILTKKKAANDS